MDAAKILEALAGWLPVMTALCAQSGDDSPGNPPPPAEETAEAGPLVNVFDFEALARRRLSRMAFDYVSSGAGDEITLRRNRECFDQMRLKPRVLVDVSKIDTGLELFGEKLDYPILLAPCAYQKLMHPEGEIATAQGAASARVPFVVSTFATVALEEIARVSAAPLWFQLYVQPDHGFTRDLIQRAEAAGYRVLCVTVDTPILGIRDREKRAGFHLPPGIERANLKALGTGATKVGHFQEGTIYNLLDPAINWDTIAWIRSLTKMPVVLKGILTPEDARLAREHGVSGIIVSNHGGRNLDTVPATIEALPAVIEAVEGRIPVLLDGGVRRGTDVVKALALGAQAVLIARPYLWGLGVNGAQGVERVVQILRTELEAAMALCGTPSLSRITRSVLWPEK